MMFDFEKVSRPIKPTDHQVQKSSLRNIVPEMLREAINETRRDHPNKTFNGYRCQIVEDGAGDKHYNITVFFTDDTPTLPHNNLNGVPQAAFGQVLIGEDLARHGIGVGKDWR